jgi:hypothetical protein
MIDFEIDIEVEELETLCKKFSREVLLPNARRYEKNLGWDSSALKSYFDLGISNLLLTEEYGGFYNPMATVVAFSQLACGDCSGVIRYEELIPVSPFLTVIGNTDVGEKINVKHLIKSLQSNSNLISKNSTVKTALVNQCFDELKNEKVVCWIPGIVFSEADNKVEAGGLENKEQILFVAGGDFVATFNISDLKVTTATAGGLRSACGGLVEINFNNAKNQSMISFEEGFYIRSTIRLWAASMLIGLGTAASSYAIDYGKERIVFEKPVLGHQANAFTLSKLVTDLEACKTALFMGAGSAGSQLNETDQYACWLITQAYVKACETSTALCDFSLQLLGGHGYMKDHIVEKWWRESQDLVNMFGGRISAIEDLRHSALKSTDWLSS